MDKELYEFDPDAKADQVNYAGLTKTMIEDKPKLEELVREQGYHDEREPYVMTAEEWSETMNGKIPNEFPKKFISSKKLPFRKRSKCIHKIEPTKYIDIHYGFAKNQKNIYDMFHFYNWTKTGRKIKLEREEVIHL